MNTPTVLLSTAYLPPISYFALLVQYPVLIEKHETYSKQTYRNRCHIYSDKGKMTLSIPVRKPEGNHSKTTHIEILYQEKWYLKHWRALLAAYESSPFFLYYKDDLYSFFTGNDRNLFDFNLKLIDKLCQLIDFTPEISFTESFEKNPQTIIDLRNKIHPKTNTQITSFPPYVQVFKEKYEFLADLSILDLLFNLGPETKNYLEGLKFSF